MTFSPPKKIIAPPSSVLLFSKTPLELCHFVMAASDADKAKGQKNLDTILDAAVSLVQQLQVALAEIHRDPKTTSIAPNDSSSSSSSTADPVALARDSASLIRAHSTKLSLLMINEPFTPSALITVIRDLTAGPIPGLASALESCTSAQYTSVFRRELAWRCRTVLMELGHLLQKIPKDGKSLSAAEQGKFKSGDKGSVALTGVLWSACDGVTTLANMGVAGFFVKKAEEWRDTLKDVMEELKEWGEEEPDDEDDDNDDDDDDVDELGDQLGASNLSDSQDMIDDLLNAHRTIPRADPDRIRPRLETSLKRLRLVVLLYQAIVKRRVKKLPALPATAVAQRLDEAAAMLQLLPDRFGDLAAAFYELQAADIDAAMDQCFRDATAVSELLGQSWDGGKDEFTEWTDKFRAEIRKE